MLAFNCVLDNEAFCCLFIGHGAMFCGKDANTSANRKNGCLTAKGRSSADSGAEFGPSMAPVFRKSATTCPMGGKNEPDEISDRVGDGCGRFGHVHDGRRR